MRATLSRTRLSAPVLLVLAMVAVPVGAQNPGAEQAVKDVVARVISAAEHVDVDKLYAEFAPDARMIVNGDVLTSVDAMRAMTVPAYAGMRSQDIRVEHEVVQLVTADVAVHSATASWTDVDTAGRSTSGTLAWTMVLTNQGGAWRVSHLQESIVQAPAAEVSQAGAAGGASAHYESAASMKFAPVPGEPRVADAAMYGDQNRDAPHAEIVRFAPGYDAGMHVHTNTVTMVVLKGAYLYRDDAGLKRVAAGDFLRIPAGHKHWSGADPKAGAVFYMHMDARMDQTPVK